MGTKLAGTNSLDLWSTERGVDVLWYDLDHPQDSSLSTNFMGSAHPTELEFLTQGGDSGGGIFASDSVGYSLLGIVGAGFIPFPHGDPAQFGAYGEYARAYGLRTLWSWIESTVGGG